MLESLFQSHCHCNSQVKFFRLNSDGLVEEEVMAKSGSGGFCFAPTLFEIPAVGDSAFHHRLHHFHRHGAGIVLPGKETSLMRT